MADGVKKADIVLGFDHGAKYIGAAVGQTLTKTATPLQTIKVRSGKPDWISISSLIQTWRPAALVVGLPIRRDDSLSESGYAAQRFSRQLHGRYCLPVHLVNEYLSSHAAAERTSKSLHSTAAQVILETWFSDMQP